MIVLPGVEDDAFAEQGEAAHVGGQGVQVRAAVLNAGQLCLLVVIEGGRAADLPHVHSFTRGLDLDIQAATAALTMPHHNGRTEGASTRTKMIKRQMYGRAGFDLLRHRILLN